jgi:hypothetical protein
MSNKFTIVTPHAAVLIWNYADRYGLDAPAKDPNKEQNIDQIILNTLSLKSISTSKNKGAAGGTFELRLAPFKNWIGAITPGSWCVILMTRQSINNIDVEKTGSGKADKRKVKFIGRIVSVRCNIGVNQTSGARETEYIVTGVDWSDCFNNTLYVDPFMIKSDQNTGGITQNMQLLLQVYEDELKSTVERKGEMPKTLSLIKSVLKIWSEGLKTAKEQQAQLSAIGSNIKVNPLTATTIPIQLLRYLGLDNDASNPQHDTVLESKIQIQEGVLAPLMTGSPTNPQALNDKYMPVFDGTGILLIQDLLGSHSIWSLLLAHCNELLNELIADIRWDRANGRDVAQFTLYKRIRPFIINKSRLLLDNTEVGESRRAAGADSVESYVSQFSNLRRVYIPVQEVLACNIGTNWYDKINFIEITPTYDADNQLMPVVIKERCQFYDLGAIRREGLRPKFAAAKQWAVDPTNGHIAPGDETHWKYLMKEWYFDLHRMMSGTLTIVGQDQYMQVGDNIIVDSDVVGQSHNYTSIQQQTKQKTYMLAHIESINHNFSVNSNGSRSFITTVGFVRGIITNYAGIPVTSSLRDEGKLEQDATLLSPSQERNRNLASVSTSTLNDPDPEKLDGE